MAAWMGGRYEPTMALQSVRLDCTNGSSGAWNKGSATRHPQVASSATNPQTMGLNGSLNKLVQAMAMWRAKVSRASVQAVHAQIGQQMSMGSRLCAIGLDTTHAYTGPADRKLWTAQWPHGMERQRSGA